MQRLEEEVTWLRAENGSVFLLKQEKEALQAQITVVRQERDRLLREKRDLQQTIGDLRCHQERKERGVKGEVEVCMGTSAGRYVGRPSRDEMVLEVEDYEEEEDREIAALLKKNEESLRELRESMVSAKVEMDLHDYCSQEGQDKGNHRTS